jgi:hypothetical protein
MIGEASVSDPSNVYYGNVSSANTDPTPTSPSGTVGTDRPDFKWKSVGLANSYKLAVYSDAEASYVIQSTVSNSSCTATECTYSSPVSLSNGNYRFKVLASTSGGTTPYSDWLSFTVTGVVVSPPTEPPVLIGPTSTMNTHRPTFQWNAVPNATFYRLAVYSNDTSAYVIVENVYPSCAAGVCSYTPSTWDLPNGNYKFKMRSRNSAGYTDFGEMSSFVVSSDLPVAPALLAPSGTVAENPPAIQWEAVSGATKYRLMVYSKMSGSYILDTEITPGVCSGSTCTYGIPVSLASGGYKFKMLTFNYYGMSGFSAFMNFTVP